MTRPAISPSNSWRHRRTNSTARWCRRSARTRSSARCISRQRRAGLGVLIGLFRAFGRSDVIAAALSASPYPCGLWVFRQPVRRGGVPGGRRHGRDRRERHLPLCGRPVSELVRHRGRESIGFYFGLADRPVRLRPGQGRGMEGDGARPVRRARCQTVGRAPTPLPGRRTGGWCSPTRPACAT